VNRDRHAGDVPDPDGGRKGGGQSLEVGDVARLTGIIVLAGRDGESVAQTADLNEAQPYGQEHAGPQQEQDHEWDGLVSYPDSQLDDVAVAQVGQCLEELHAAPL
jgi:hypothetical protein